jgi:tetratricopeptide (TPR) repeat protein
MVYSLQKVIELGEPFNEVVLQANDLLNIFTMRTYKETGLGLDDYIKSMKLFNEAFEFLQNKKWKKAIAGFEKTIAINPNSAPTFGNLGICYMYLGENEKALAAYDRAIEIDPTYGPALLNRENLKDSIKNNTSPTRLKMKEVNYAKDIYEKIKRKFKS